MFRNCFMLKYFENIILEIFLVAQHKHKHTYTQRKKEKEEKKRKRKIWEI